MTLLRSFVAGTLILTLKFSACTASLFLTVGAFAAGASPPAPGFADETGPFTAMPFASCIAAAQEEAEELSTRGGCESGKACIAQSAFGHAAERTLPSIPSQLGTVTCAVTVSNDRTIPARMLARARASPLFEHAPLFARITVKRE